MSKFWGLFGAVVMVLAAVGCKAVGEVGPQEPAGKCSLKEPDGTWWHGVECPDTLGGGCCPLNHDCRAAIPSEGRASFCDFNGAPYGWISAGRDAGAPKVVPRRYH